MSHPKFIPIDQAQTPLFAGVDLGGTNIKVGVVDDQGRPLSWLSIRTDPERGPEDGTRRMGDAVRAAVQQAGARSDQVARVGLGSPGTMDIPAGLLLDPPNLPGWINFPIRSRLESHCDLPVTFENDANAAAYGEFWVGSGRALRSMVMFTLGTGIGCGIVVDDVVLRGEHSHGGECGHIIIDYRDDAAALLVRTTGPSRGLWQRQGGRASNAAGAGRRPGQLAGRRSRPDEPLTPLLWLGRPNQGTRWRWNWCSKRRVTWAWAW